MSAPDPSLCAALNRSVDHPVVSADEILGVAMADSPIDMPDLGWMLPVERRFAVMAYGNWSRKLDRQRPGQPQTNRRVAIQAAYLGAACMWMAIWVPLLLVLAMTFQSNHVLTVVLVAIVAVPFVMFFFRVIQGVRAYSGYSILGDS